MLIVNIQITYVDVRHKQGTTVIKVYKAGNESENNANVH